MIVSVVYLHSNFLVESANVHFCIIKVYLFSPSNFGPKYQDWVD